MLTVVDWPAGMVTLPPFHVTVMAVLSVLVTVNQWRVPSPEPELQTAVTPKTGLATSQLTLKVWL